jgi:hypothetical protein
VTPCQNHLAASSHEVFGPAREDKDRASNTSIEFRLFILNCLMDRCSLLSVNLLQVALPSEAYLSEERYVAACKRNHQ